MDSTEGGTQNCAIAKRKTRDVSTKSIFQAPTHTKIKRDRSPFDNHSMNKKTLSPYLQITASTTTTPPTRRRLNGKHDDIPSLISFNLRIHGSISELRPNGHRVVDHTAANEWEHSMWERRSVFRRLLPRVCFRVEACARMFSVCPVDVAKV